MQKAQNDILLKSKLAKIAILGMSMMLLVYFITLLKISFIAVLMHVFVSILTFIIIMIVTVFNSWLKEKNYIYVKYSIISLTVCAVLLTCIIYYANITLINLLYIVIITILVPVVLLVTNMAGYLIVFLSTNNIVASWKYNKAESRYLLIIAILENSYFFNFITADMYNSLGILYDRTCRYSDAEMCYLRSVAIYEEKNGPNCINASNARNSLAWLYNKTGRYSEAER